jgi:hypothetical protein
MENWARDIETKIKKSHPNLGWPVTIACQIKIFTSAVASLHTYSKTEEQIF